MKYGKSYKTPAAVFAACLIMLLSGCDLFNPEPVAPVRDNIYDPGSDGYVGVLLTAPIGTLDDALPTFTWTASILPDPVYHLQVGLDSAISDPDIDVDSLTATSYTVTERMENDITIYWRVSVRDESGREIWAPTETVAVSYVLKVVNISVGVANSAAIREDGSLWTAGDNSLGQLGNGTTVHEDLPIELTTLTGCVVVEITTPEIGVMDPYQIFVIDGEDRLWGWGINDHGQLGNSTTTDSLSPVLILSDVAAVSGSGYHTLALKTDGSLWSWGNNGIGQLGDGTTIERLSPVQVRKSATPDDYLTGIVSFSCDTNISTAVLEDGSLWCWGDNSWGQSDYPQQITETIDGGALPAMEFVETNVWGCIFCIDQDGTLWSCGSNEAGILGDGTEIGRDKPVQVSITGPIEQICVRRGTAFALDSSGTLWRWGEWYEGNTETSPIQFMSDVSFVAGGIDYGGCCLKTDGSLWFWGDNSNMIYGNGTTEGTETPIEVEWP